MTMDNKTFTSTYGCLDCGKLDSYMVKEEVWLKAVPDYVVLHAERKAKGLATCVCLSCLERRLERPLELEDFMNFPINYNILFGYRLAVRELWRKDWRKQATKTPSLLP